MPDFYIEQWELHTSTYRIREVDNEEEAVAKLLAGEGELQDDSLEYVEPAQRYGEPPTIREIMPVPESEMDW